MAGNIFPISGANHHLELGTGRFDLDILGGWGVKLGNFSIRFTHKASGKTITPVRVFWKRQSYVFNQRAKRMFTIEIKEPGTYDISFHNPESLSVTRTGLIFRTILQEPLPVSQIAIFIH